MDAVILAGGKGERLQAHTARIPKPPSIGDTPILEIVLRQLARSGFERHASPSRIAPTSFARCAAVASASLEIRPAGEERPLSTAGPLEKDHRLGNPCLVMNADVLTSLDYASLIDAHAKSAASATIAVCERRVRLDLGVIVRNEDGTLRDYDEKPELRHTVAMGINVFDPRLFAAIGREEVLDMPRFLLRLMRSGEIIRTFETDALWFHLARRDDYERAVAELDALNLEALPSRNAGLPS
jgi:NDP-sugar pyrophosphorylase family protein